MFSVSVAKDDAISKMRPFCSHAGGLRAARAAVSEDLLSFV